MYQAQESKIIPASAELIYNIITDYHEGHPAILPTRYFTHLEIVEGGRGLGTVIDVEMSFFGAKAAYHLEITEARPYTLMVEEDKAQGVVTSFILDPLDENQTRVTIQTKMPSKAGLAGWVEKQMNSWVMRKVYREELDQLAEYAGEKSRALS